MSIETAKALGCKIVNSFDGFNAFGDEYFFLPEGGGKIMMPLKKDEKHSRIFDAVMSDKTVTIVI